MEIRKAGLVACLGDMNILFGEPEGKSPLGRRRSRREDNIK
jgi:hypothetical protein